MINEILYRDARREEAFDIASLYQLSGGGVADYIWSLMKDEYPGRSLLEIGAERYARINTEFSYQNCLLADFRGEIIGMVHSYPMTEKSPPCENPVLAPYCALEAVGSLYISGIALYPNYRGQGIGTIMMKQINERAKNLGLKQLSLLAFEQNLDAIRLYERLGFEITDRLTVVTHPLIQYTGDVVLMVADVE